jgi:hypothetical protein
MMVVNIPSGCRTLESRPFKTSASLDRLFCKPIEPTKTAVAHRNVSRGR